MKSQHGNPLGAYLDHVLNEPEALSAWNSNRTWTPIATKGLAALGRRLCKGFRTETAHKGNPDVDGHSEYLTLDVTIWNARSWWSPLLFAAETESKGGHLDEQYSAWKLLVTNARVRVLLAYYGGAYRYPTLPDLTRAIQEVCSANPGRELVLLAAEGVAARSVDEIRALHQPPRRLIGRGRRAGVD